MKKKILSILLSLCMVVTLMPQMATAAGVTDSTPSVSAYATKAQLMDGTFAPNSSGTAANKGKLVFGKNSSRSAQEWYVLGRDSGVAGDNTVLFAAAPIVTGQVFDGDFYSSSWKNKKTDASLWSDCKYSKILGINAPSPQEVYPNHYGSSDLRRKLQALATENFTAAEQGLMNSTTVTTKDTLYSKKYPNITVSYTTKDKLYALQGSDGETVAKAGSSDQKVLSMSSYWNGSNSAFWLRTPGESDIYPYSNYSLAGAGYTGNSVALSCVAFTSDVRPAANIDLSDVLFASAAVAGTSATEASYGTIASGSAMTLRLDGSGKYIGNVGYNSISGEIYVTRGYTSLPVSLVVQGKDGSTDWYYSQKYLGVNTTATVKADDIKSALNLSSDIDLASCRIWLEAYSTPSDRGNGLIYAVEAEETADVINTSYASKEQLMYSFVPSRTGTAVNIGKLEFGKDSGGDAQEWYILGRDTGVSGSNTVLFAADPIANGQSFEGTSYNDLDYKGNENKKTVDNLGSDCTYAGSAPTEVYRNHYGSSSLRSKLQALATENFTAAERGLMNSTTVTTRDTNNGKDYTTSDKLYVLAADGFGDSYTAIKAGSGNQIVLEKSVYWNIEQNCFWLRTPGKNINDTLCHDSAFALYANSDSSVLYYPVLAAYDVQPAANINLSNVLFASAADAGVSGTIAPGKAMTLRLDGKDKEIGSVAYDMTTGDINAVKGSTSGTVYLVVQLGDSYYSKKITEAQTVVSKSEIKAALNQTGDIDLSSCHIWLETTGDDEMIYAVTANGCSTEADLLEAINAGKSSVSLTGDITLSSKLNLTDKIITIDLNGHTLKGDIYLADSSAAPKSILTLVDSNPEKGGVLNGRVTLTRGNGSVSHLYANGGTITGMVSLPSYAGGIFCTSSTPTVFKGYAGNYGEIHAGIYYGGINESCIKEKSVKFMNGDSQYALEVVSSGNKAIEPVKPSKNGCRFVGWYNGDTKYDFTSAVTENITLEAKWISENISTEAELKDAVKYGSTFVRLVNDIKLDSSASSKFSLSDKQLTVDLNGHKLTGYFLLADTSAAPQSILTLMDSSIEKTGLLEGTIELTRGTYGTASYLYANGGTVNAKVSMNSYIAKIFCTNGTPTAFTGIVGNYGEIHGGIFYGSVSEGSIKEKTVTFMDGGSRHALEVVPSGKTAAAPKQPANIKDGYRSFDGWYNGDAKYSFTSAVYSNLTLTAQYGDPIEYSITCNLNGGTADNETAYTIESDDITLNNPVKAGHVFTGWSETGVEGPYRMIVTIPKGSTGNREYTAHYAEITGYTVTFNTNGGTEISPSTKLDENSKVLYGIDEPKKTGYTFAGWKYGEKSVGKDTTYGNLAVNGDEEILSEIQLTAQWTENSDYVVKYDCGEGRILAGENSISITGVKWTDKVLTGLIVPVRDGYTFAGWKYNDTDVTADNTYGQLAVNDNTESITLVAQWTQNPGTVTPPAGSITIGETIWNTFSNIVEFNKFYKTEQSVTITPTGSETVSIGYLLSDTPLTIEELDGADFTDYTKQPINLGINHEHIVYAKLTDASGSSAYINSTGIVIDNASPVISGVEDGDTYCSSCKVTVTDKYLDKVTVNTEEVQLDKNGQFTLSEGENRITATDKSGNTASVTVNAIEGHKDTDNNHKCDYCGLNISDHADANRDSICDICGEILSEETTGYIPVDKPVIENSDEGTSADLSSTTNTSDGTTSAAIDKETADKIVANAVENSSGAIVIDATAKTQAAAASANTSQIEIPSSALADISEKTDADVTIRTDVGEVTIDNTAAGEIAANAEGETVQIILSRDKDTNDSVNLEIKVVSSEDKVITDFGEGKVTVTADIDDALKGNDPVCVYIDEDGIYQKVSGALNEDGTFTFTLEQAGTYSVLPKEQADKVIKDQEIAAVKRIKPVVTLTTKNIKRGIKVSVKIPASQKADKTGIIIYRSTKKSSGYAMYRKVKTSKATYTVTNTLNVKGNRLVKGKRYYYKARVYKVIDGKTYYGPMSSIKYMRAK